MEGTRNRQAEARALAGGGCRGSVHVDLQQLAALIPIILVGNIDIRADVSHALGMTTYDRTERRYVDLLRVASSRCRPIAS
jgi:hypothetical protein